MNHLPIPKDIATEIVKACHKLYTRGLVANHDGNITYRIADGFFAATPTAFSKGDVSIDDLLVVDAKGQVIAGTHKVFSEISWHMAIYRSRSDVACIVHGHPVTASAYALAGRELGTPAVPEAIVSLGKHILTSRFYSPVDSSAFSEGGAFETAVEELLSESDAFLVPGNGAWAVGQSPMQTYYRLELTEHVAQQHKAAEQLGELKRLPAELVAQLMSRRPKTGAPKNAVTASPQASVLPAVNSALLATTNGPAEVTMASHTQGLTPADLKEIVRAELEQFLR